MRTPSWPPRLLAAANWPATVRPIVQLLFSGPPAQRPDALVIGDDNLTEDCMAALMATGIRVPDELDIVTQCSWPRPIRNVLPARRLGYNVRQLLETAIRLTDALRRGETVAQHTPVPALFDDELPAETASS